MKRKLIHVIQEDIDKGERKDCGHCPIALAILRELGLQNTDNIYVWVTYGEIQVDRGEFWPNKQRLQVDRGEFWLNKQGLFDGLMNKTSQRFIQRFDKGLSVKPFNFYAVLR